MIHPGKKVKENGKKYLNEEISDRSFNVHYMIKK